ncbi:hypothetical protein BX666DRAFT_1987878 [Dichotomocladium elegans]|nr:hypothetical protein BX666DRAFT_1987878 [Dichotomocladium elegans]
MYAFDYGRKQVDLCTERKRKMCAEKKKKNGGSGRGWGKAKIFSLIFGEQRRLPPTKGFVGGDIGGESRHDQRIIQIFHVCRGHSVIRCCCCCCCGRACCLVDGACKVTVVGQQRRAPGFHLFLLVLLLLQVLGKGATTRVVVRIRTVGCCTSELHKARKDVAGNLHDMEIGRRCNMGWTVSLRCDDLIEIPHGHDRVRHQNARVLSVRLACFAT